MKDPQTQYAHDIALFRYGVIAELVHLPPATKGLYARIAELAKRDYTVPGSERTRFAPETIRHWLKRYRHGGFEALLPKPRTDRGRSRTIPDAIAEQLLCLKAQHPALSVRLLIDRARIRGGIPSTVHLPPSTVHRLLERHGLMAKTQRPANSTDRRRFAFDKPAELWMSDVMHGPAVPDNNRRKRKAYLIAFIDDATRIIPYATFTHAENTATFLPVFKQAILRRGLPARLYVDNGANFRSQQLALVCAKLGVALIHARPYQPQGKGKIERWFRTVRAQLLAHLGADDTASLETLNRKLWAFVEGEYHHAPHRGLDGQTPLERWAQSADEVRYPEPTLDLDELFLFEAKRRVQKDRTLSLHRAVYEVDAALIGENVTGRYDPAAPPGRAVEIWHDGLHVQLAKPLDAYANAHVKRHRPSLSLQPDTPPASPPTGLALRKLNDPEKENL